MEKDENIRMLFAAALQKHLAGDVLAAETRYREIIQADPTEARAKHYLGFLLQQSERLEEACEQLHQAIALDDRHAEWHFNLGIVLSRQGLAASASAAFSRAVSLDPGKYFYWTNLGAALELNREWARAEQCYLRAASIDPACPDAFFLLSALCLAQERFALARHYNYSGIVAAPGNSRIILGQAYHALGRVDDAIALFENWLSLEPDNPVASHLLAAYRGQLAPCTAEYIEQTFDAFAYNFEDILGRLKYSGPQLLQDYLSTLPCTNLWTLDLGCGTGLMGPILKPVSRVLTGVDLSAAMLEKASEKKLYDRLHKADITNFLHTSNERYDLITCMDTFTYLGSLDEVLTQINQKLNSAGRLIFSTEKLSGSSHFQLNVSGRYSHHPDYLSAILGKSGFLIELIQDIDIRMESGCPIAGQFICATRP
jgi:predicted TPR repeat methyltransferase